jgi:hypothetical protein
VGQERLGPFYFFISLVLGPLNSLVWYVPSLMYTRGLGWRMHCGVKVTESSTNKQRHLSQIFGFLRYGSCAVTKSRTRAYMLYIVAYIVASCSIQVFVFLSMIRSPRSPRCAR